MLNLAEKSVDFTYFIINFQWTVVVPLMVTVLLPDIGALFPAIHDDTTTTAAAAVFTAGGKNVSETL